jgi:hypothetical protein
MSVEPASDCPTRYPPGPVDTAIGKRRSSSDPRLLRHPPKWLNLSASEAPGPESLRCERSPQKGGGIREKSPRWA